MSRPFSSQRWPILLLFLLGWLGAMPAPAVHAEPATLQSQAEKREAGGDDAEAAQLFLQAATDAEPLARPALLLRAGEAAVRGNRRDLAVQALQGLNEQQLDGAQRLRVNLLRVEVGQLSDDPGEVLRRLPPPQEGSDPRLAARIWGARADAFLRHGDVIEAVRAMVMRERWLRSSREAAANRTRIWQTLRATPVMNSQFQRRNDLDGTTRGWLELALVERRSWESAEAREQELRRWQDSYPGHPARDDILDLVRDTPPVIVARPKPPEPPPAPVAAAAAPAAAARAAAPTPAVAASLPPAAGIAIPVLPLPAGSARTVALILPLNGALAPAARAVRDGFLAAYYEQPQPRPRLLVYDSGAGTEGVFALYERAVEAGAELVIGPLAKEAVSTLSRLVSPKQPVLALNYLETTETAPPNFFQFGLAPEDEARQVAERAVAEGRLRALALVPEGEWGSRTLAAFRERYAALGGNLLNSASFGSRSQDIAPAVARLLRIMPGADKTGERVLFQPGPGNNPDFVFIAAQPQQARQIRPQFRFYGAGHLPMYATSHVYEGLPAATRDADLDGILFCDMPWTLGAGEAGTARDRLQGLWGDAYARYPRLYALGYDAARVMPLLSGRAGAGLYAAATGNLQLGSDGRIRRQLLWARFENGRPRLLTGLIGTP